MRLTSLALDLLVVLAFAAFGRLSHYGELSALGVLETGWPFAVGMAIGWVLAGRSGRRLRGFRAGLLIWLLTLILGIALRLLTDEGAAPSFIAVSAGVLGAGMLGWRGIVAFVSPPPKGPS